MKLLIACSLLVCAMHHTEAFNFGDIDHGSQGNQDKGNQGKGNEDHLEDRLGADKWDPHQSGVVDTCDQQKDVVQFTIDHQPGSCKDQKGKDLGYQFNVCMHLNLKDRPSVKKSCVKDATIVNPPPFYAYKDKYWVNSSVGMAMGDEIAAAGHLSAPDYPVSNSSMQCQLGCPLDTLFFSLHDGELCQPTAESGLPDYATITGTQAHYPGNVTRPVDISCKSRAGWLTQINPILALNDSCICEAPKAECVWKIDLPEPAVPFDASPNPSPSCFCPPESAYCQKEINTAVDDGKTIEIDVLDCGNPAYLADKLSEFGCKASADCPTVICDQFVPQKYIDDLSTCPTPSQ